MTRDPDRPAPIPHVPRHPDPTAARAGPAPHPMPVWAWTVIGLCCLIEALMWLAPLAGFEDARQFTFLLGAFWSPLIWGAAGLFGGQAATMFLSYGLLHAGPLHLAMNMISFMAVGRELAHLIGPWRMALIYLGSQIGAALTFGWLQPEAGPMIGASGAVFGVAAALVLRAAFTLRRRRRSTRPLVRAVALILGLNVVLTVIMPSIAWEAHLGGAVTGLVMAALLGTRRA